MRVYAIKPDVVDKALGTGVYSAWEKVLDSFIEEQTRAYENETRYEHVWARRLRRQLQADLAFAEKAVDDYAVFLERVSASGVGMPAEGEKILDVLLLAISVLTSVNDLLDELHVLNIRSLLTALAAAKLELEAAQAQAALKKWLKRLQADLDKAKREMWEASAQTAINLALAAGTACLGPVGILAAGAFFVVEQIVDQSLGPEKSGFADWGDNTVDGLDAAGNAAEKYVKEGTRTAKVVKAGGKVFFVAGFLFDAYEVYSAHGNAKEVEKQMVEAKAAHDKLMTKIKANMGTLSALALKLRQLRRELDTRSNLWTAEIRRDLEEAMQRTGYRPSP